MSTTTTVQESIIVALKAANITLSEVRIEVHPNDLFDDKGNPQAHFQNLIKIGFRYFDIAEFEADPSRPSGTGRVNELTRKVCMMHAQEWGRKARESHKLLTSFGPDFLRVEAVRASKMGVTPESLLASAKPKTVRSEEPADLADLDSLFG